jgi:alpha-tubulin suppressor-like RCC1 family protein
MCQLALISLCIACRETQTVERVRPGAVHAVELTPVALSLVEADTTRVRAIPRDSAGVIVPRTRALWSSESRQIATVDSLGLVLAVSAGQTSIRASVNGVIGSAPVVVQPASATAFVRIDAGAEHTCAITGAGRVFCWGSNTFGQLGSAAQSASVSPVAVGALDAVSVASANRHTCVAARFRGLWCWGSNSAGQLGDSLGDKKVHPVPIAASDADEFVHVSAGSAHSCALTVDGRAFCWGSNALGQIGQGSAGGIMGATLLSDSLRFRDLSAGQAHTCGVRLNGEIWCWGWNQFNQLGVATADSCAESVCQAKPVRVSSTVRFRSVSVGYASSCALSESGAAHCWGSNGDGQLGDGSRTAATQPVRVQGPTFVQFDAGSRHVCALTESGETYCWGANPNGELGSVSAPSSAVPIRANAPLLRWVSAGGGHSCGVTVSGAAYCWGDAGSGKLGIR